MTLLFPFSLAGFYCRSSYRRGCVVLFVPYRIDVDHYDTAFPTWFRANGGRLLDRDDTGGYAALLLTGPQWLMDALRASVPAPPSHGSRTLGNFLRW
jgi:hypothetical protein